MSGERGCECSMRTEQIPGVPAPGPPACACGTSEGSESPPRDPISLPVARAPGTPTPISRFDLQSELARRGIPAAYPQGYDPRIPLPPPETRSDPRTDPVTPGLDRGADGLLPPPAAPDFIDRNVLPRDSKIAGVCVESPSGRLASPARTPHAARHRPSHLASPDGTALDCGAPAPAMAPDGTAPDCAAWSVVTALPGAERDSVGPPEYFPDIDSLLNSRQSSREAAREREMRRRRELEQRARTLAAAPRAVASGVEDPGSGTTESPGAAPCTKDPGFQTMSPAGHSGVGPPGVEQFRGKGGPTDIYRPDLGPSGGAPPGEEQPKDDPCPCKCVCVPLFPCGPFIFQPSTGTTQSVSTLFGPDRGYFGRTEGLPTPERPVVATDNGLIEQVRSQTRFGAPEGYGTPSGQAPASTAPLEGISTFVQASIASEASVQSGPSVLLYPPLDQDPDLEGLRLRTAATPAGPGPGIVETEGRPMTPAGGGGMRSPPGSLPAWLSYQSNNPGSHAAAHPERPTSGRPERARLSA